MAGETRTMIAICGDSGTGKSTLASGILKLLGDTRVTTVCTDDYHSLDRRQRGASGITALDPRANNLAMLADHVRRLRYGQAIAKPVYDHTDGTIKGPETVAPHEFVFVQGLHPLFTPDLRACFDLKVYLDPHPVLKRAWKIKRDVAKRGYAPAQVEAEIAARQPDAEAYILPQKAHADVIVSFYPPHDPFDVTSDNAHLNVRVLTRADLPPLDPSEIGAAAGARRDFWQHEERLDDGTPVSVLEIRGDMERGRALALEELIWEHIGPGQALAIDKLGQFLDGLAPAKSEPLGLVQLVLLWRILAGRGAAAARGDGAGRASARVREGGRLPAAAAGS